MKILFARHGESEANTLREFSNRGLKHPLTPLGRQQASILAHKLEGQSIHRIYSSPVLRAIETSAIVANYLGVGYEVTEALREYDVGYLEGRVDQGAWQLFRELFEDWLKHRRLEQRIEGGESFYDVQSRFVPFIDSLIEQHQGEDVSLLCIAHGGLYWMMLPQVLINVDVELLSRHNGGIDYTTLIVAEPSPAGLICLEWNGIRIGPSSQVEL